MELVRVQASQVTALTAEIEADRSFQVIPQGLDGRLPGRARISQAVQPLFVGSRPGPRKRYNVEHLVVLPACLPRLKALTSISSPLPPRAHLGWHPA